MGRCQREAPSSADGLPVPLTDSWIQDNMLSEPSCLKGLNEGHL